MAATKKVSAKRARTAGVTISSPKRTGSRKTESSSGPSPVFVRGRKDYEKLHPKEQEARQRAYEAIAEMRRGKVSLTAASRLVGTTPETVRRYASEALTKKGRRYMATAADRSYQRMSALTIEGLQDIDTRGSKSRSLVSAHWRAVNRFSATGDVFVLIPFKGKRVGGYTLATDPDQIEEYARRGELDIDDIYA